MKGSAFNLPWNEAKLIVNAARRSRGPWKLSASLDSSGLLCYQNVHGVWLNPSLPAEVAAAVLNGPVANAFVDSVEDQRHVRIQTLRRIPVPGFTHAQEERISSLVRRYSSVRNLWLAGELGQDEALERCSESLHLIDTAILSAYDLPPSVEHELLAHFAGHERVGPIKTLPLSVAGANAELRSAFHRFQGSGLFESASFWTDEVGEAVYAYGVVAVELLREYWSGGWLKGNALCDALVELGYVDEPSSHRERRTLLVDALKDGDPQIRHSAARGLYHLADREALQDLSGASSVEKYPLVKSQIDGNRQGAPAQPDDAIEMLHRLVNAGRWAEPRLPGRRLQGRIIC